MSERCERCEELERELRRALREILALRRAIAAARSACEVYLAQAREVLGQRSGVPRGTWAYWKGVGDVASRVAALLEVGDNDNEW